ncbi:LPXTG cell wall anchor domain-containing protein, partial [Escherichia coli]|nr:LPXTG cell wall anchor domain-containing protein [Escherichia coli]
VGGRGDASGENKPIWEIPNDAPKYEKPSIDLKDIPLMPPAPIVDIPEWKGGTTPWDAPQYDKPEWNGGTVPFDAPVLDKPEINIEDIPMMPPAPVLEKPELIIDLPKPNTPTVTIDKPSIPVEINSKPSKTTVEPQKEQVNVIYQPTKTNAHTLPNTGTESSLVLSFAGMFILGGMARIALKHEGE